MSTLTLSAFGFKIPLRQTARGEGLYRWRLAVWQKRERLRPSPQPKGRKPQTREMSFHSRGKLAVRPALHRLLVPFWVVRSGFVRRQMQWRTPSGVVSHGASPVPVFDGGRRFCCHDPPLCAAQFFFFFKKPHQTFPAASSTTTSLSVRWCSAGPQRKTPREGCLVVGKEGEASRRRRKWHRCWNAMLVAVAAVDVALLVKKYEAIPYSGRYQLALLPLEEERELGNLDIGMVKEWGSGVLPPDHPQSVRVKEVFGRLLAAMEEELKLGSGGGDRVLQGRRHVFTRHLRGLEWEVVVVKDDYKMACSASGGKIAVFTGFLDHAAPSEVELAIVIGHEMGHVVARHLSEALSVECLARPLYLLLSKFDVGARLIDYLRQGRPFSHRREKEADLIGLFLSSSAGYDPRVVPDFYRKLGSSKGIWEELTATHPSGTARAKHLSKPKVMKEAIARFEAAKNRNIK